MAIERCRTSLVRLSLRSSLRPAPRRLVASLRSTLSEASLDTLSLAVSAVSCRTEARRVDFVTIARPALSTSEAFNQCETCRPPSLTYSALYEYLPPLPAQQAGVRPRVAMPSFPPSLVHNSCPTSPGGTTTKNTGSTALHKSLCSNATVFVLAPTRPLSSRLATISVAVYSTQLMIGLIYTPAEPQQRLSPFSRLDLPDPSPLSLERTGFQRRPLS